MTLVKRSRHVAEPVTAATPAALDGYLVLETEAWREASPRLNTAMDEKWATCITWTRHLALSWLWLTFVWIRFAVFSFIVLSVVLVVALRIWS